MLRKLWNNPTSSWYVPIIIEVLLLAVSIVYRPAIVLFVAGLVLWYKHNFWDSKRSSTRVITADLIYPGSAVIVPSRSNLSDGERRYLINKAKRVVAKVFPGCEDRVFKMHISSNLFKERTGTGKKMSNGKCAISTYCKGYSVLFGDVWYEQRVYVGFVVKRNNRNVTAPAVYDIDEYSYVFADSKYVLATIPGSIDYRMVDSGCYERTLRECKKFAEDLTAWIKRGETGNKIS